MPFFADGASARLALAYPQEPMMLRHNLAGEPLLGLSELARASAEFDPQLVERRVHNAENGGNFALLGHGDVDAALSGQGPVDQWIMLRFIERLPRYRALLESLVAELGDAIAAETGPPDNLKGFVFVSAPGTHTPFHFDAEFNILFQISGTKTFATYPPRPPYLDLATREAYHATGENMLCWQPDYAEAATLHHLAPGDAVFVPYAAPHWVRAGSEPSISLSLTWQNRWSSDMTEALALNPLMRRLGLPVTDPACKSGRPRWRAAASKIVQKAGVL